MSSTITMIVADRAVGIAADAELTHMNGEFLRDRPELTSLDLAPLAQLMEIRGSFMQNCGRLTSLPRWLSSRTSVARSCRTVVD